MMANQFISTGGIDYARELLEKSLGSQKAIDIINRLTSSLQVRPFDFIRRTDPAHLLNFIQQEHPQTIALILAYLEPNKSSIILQNLPHEVQSDVARRIATMDRTSPEVLREVERVLEKKLSTLSSEDYTTAGGVESIVEILNLVDRASEKQIIEALEDEDPELAEEIKKRMFVFEDIVMLDDRAIQKVMREVDSQELAKALKSVDTEVQDKIFRNMSKRAAGMLKEDMEYMGPVRLKDVEEAQQKIVSIIRHLEDTGEIVVARSGEDELVV
jgi:flagellar motor switch protein FliG